MGNLIGPISYESFRTMSMLTGFIRDYKDKPKFKETVEKDKKLRQEMIKEAVQGVGQ